MLERQEGRAKEIGGMDGSDCGATARQAGHPGQKVLYSSCYFLSLDNSVRQHSALTLPERAPKTTNQPWKHLKTAETAQDVM